MWNINGRIIKDEKALRDYCFSDVTVAGKPFKQDFRIAAKAYSASVTDLIDSLEKLGYKVEEVKAQ